MMLDWFELRIPPPAVALLAAAAMWGISLVTPTIDLPAGIRLYAAIALALLGGVVSLAGIVSFRRAKTTVNPLRPNKASSLVSSGVYRITRNPMYLGLLFVLVAWALLLCSAWALLGALAFFLFIGRFQIVPEERVLESLFGAEYSAYKASVRRWL